MVTRDPRDYIHRSLCGCLWLIQHVPYFRLWWLTSHCEEHPGMTFTPADIYGEE